jgi:sugar phosphate isomerase/epimerase
MLADSNHNVSRRSFLGSVIAGAATVGAVARGADPVTRIGQPKLKLSLAAYSFHRELKRGWPTPSADAGKMDLMDFIDFCAEQQLGATELTSYYFPNPLTHEYLMQIKEKTFRLGLDISGTAIGNDFCLPEGPARDAQLQLCRQWIDYAADMGAPVIRIFAGNVSKGDSEEQALDRCVVGINECLQHAANRGIVLALENHGGITATPRQMLAIVKRIDSFPWFGVNFDSGNFHSADPYADLEMIAPYTVNAQIKVMMHPSGAGKQPADLKRIVEILKAVNYRGYVVLEYEESNPRKEVPRYLNVLRDLLA